MNRTGLSANFYTLFIHTLRFLQVAPLFVEFNDHGSRAGPMVHVEF